MEINIWISIIILMIHFNQWKHFRNRTHNFRLLFPIALFRLNKTNKNGCNISYWRAIVTALQSILLIWWVPMVPTLPLHVGLVIDRHFLFCRAATLFVHLFNAGCFTIMFDSSCYFTATLGYVKQFVEIIKKIGSTHFACFTASDTNTIFPHQTL